MPRSQRICQPNLTYHVFSRCIEYKELLDVHTKDILLSILRRTQKKYSFDLIHYTIMSNHFHFIIRTVDEGAPISRIMQYIKSRLAETYNRLMNRIGPFWNERFKDVIIEKQDNPTRYLLWLLWYMGYNPVRKGHVKCPEQYKYCSINCYLLENFYVPVKITFHEYFIDLGSTFKERVRRFRQWEEMYRKRYALHFDYS